MCHDGEEGSGGMEGGGGGRRKARLGVYYRAGISFFPRCFAQSLFLLFFLPLAHLFSLLALFPCVYSSSFPALFPRKLQSMPRRRAMEYVCVLLDSSLALPRLPFSSLHLPSLAVPQVRRGCALHEVRFRRRVALSLSPSICLPGRCAGSFITHRSRV